MALINIAHPRFRKSLLEEAKRHAYIYPDQIFIHTENQIYPEEEESTATLSNGTVVTIRPIKPTDEVQLQDFFYSHSEETIYLRYFRAVLSMPHATAQTMVNVDYRNHMAYVATIGEIGLERIIAVGRYGAEKSSEMVEVAYTTTEEFRGMGLGTLLQGRLEAYAARMGFKGAVGYLFEDNLPMLKTFARKGQYQAEIQEDGILRVWRFFKEEH